MPTSAQNGKQMGFCIKVNGETVWETDEKVLSVSGRTAQGEAANFKVENLDVIDLVPEIRTEFNLPLTLIEEREAEALRHVATTGSTKIEDKEEAKAEKDEKDEDEKKSSKKKK